jgi:hypothetical protein
MNQACSGFFRREALKWSCLEEVFRVMCTFSKKKALTECPVGPDHLSGFFLIVKNSDRGSFVIFLGSQLYIRGWWWLVVELNSL